jgi:hypothetical protein
MGRMTSDDYCYCGAHGTHIVSSSPHDSVGLSDISVLLPLPPTMTMGYMKSDDHCYCWAPGTRVDSISPHSNDGLAVHCYWTTSSDGLAVHCYWTTSSDGLAVHWYWTASSNGLSSVIPSVMDCAAATA